MKQTKTHGLPRRLTAALLCLCMIASVISGAGFVKASSVVRSGPTQKIVSGSRVADPNTMDDYVNRLLTTTNGSRYAGRVWTDKTVFAYSGDNSAAGSVPSNKIVLDMLTDGYEGGVTFNADFAHVFSALASSQVINEYPPSPIDLVIVFDMSGSMGQDTRYGIDQGINNYVEHNTAGDSKEEPWPNTGVRMSDRIEHSRVQATLNAINETIDALMAQNPQNRVAVCGYGANAVVLMPLAHYKHQTDEEGNELPYLSVGGMETLYHPSDLVYREGRGDADGDWYWMNNRDTCYTVVVNAQYNTYTGVLSEENPENKWANRKFTVSNNVLTSKGENVSSTLPGVDVQNNDTLNNSNKFKEVSQTVYENAKAKKSGYTNGKDANEITKALSEAKSMKADDYVGYFTNTQGGIYLAYKQLADSSATTYSERLTNGVLSTVARIPAAIIMSDGGANFSFNEMGDNDGSEYTAADWNKRYGELSKDSDPEIGKTPDESTNFDDLYVNDNTYGANSSKGREKDYSHRLGGATGEQTNVGDEWYNVYLPGKETLGDGWDGLHGIYNIGADYYHDGTLSTAPGWPSAGVLYSSDNDLAGTGGAVLEVLFTAAYMNAVVKEHYKNGWTKNNATKDSQIELSTYTMNVDTEHVPQWGRWRLFPTLNPKEYNLDNVDEWSNNGQLLGEQYKGDGQMGGMATAYWPAVFGNLKEAWANWKAGDIDKNARAGVTNGIRIHLGRLPEGFTYAAGGSDIVTVTNQDVIDNIAYNNEFYDVTSENLEGIFGEILELIMGKVFVPVSGDNDAGVGDSITYQDPLGEYMEIKNQAITTTPHHVFGEGVTETETTYDMALLLFGEMHGLVRTGVYDFQWNDAWMQKHEGEEIDGTKIKPGETAFPMGWYKGETGETGQRVAGEKELPEGCNSAEEAWEKGYVFRLNNKALIEYVPIVQDTSNPDNLAPQAKNTVYTIYRFAGTTENRNALRRNPIFGAVPDELKKQWETATSGGTYPEENDIYASTPGVYRLSDIRVWIEETGDFVDEDGAITPNGGYDRALYLNIPAAAVPTELATITLGKDGVLSYETNLGRDHPEGSQIADEKTGKPVEVTEEIYKNYCYQSTPFRLFYAVGLEEDLILRDEDGNQQGVDFSAISAEYISEHTVEGQNYVWFISNYYSNTAYGDYDTDDAPHTRGDPTVTFSPSIDNRYYVFQKPLPLYAHAYRANSDGLKPVDRSEGQNWDDHRGGNGSTTWETLNGSRQEAGSWFGGQFMGVYESEEAFEDARKAATDGIITDSHGSKYQVVENGIVFLEEDLLEHVTSEAGGGYTSDSVSFSSDDYYFILVEYYIPDPNETGVDNEGDEVPGTMGARMVQYALARKGSEFGSGFTSQNIGNGDMLCWTDVNNHLNIELEYLSQSSTGDNTRGEPTFEKLTTSDENELKEYLKKCGLTDDLKVANPAYDPSKPELGVGETIGALTYATKYWLNVQKDPLVKAALKAAGTSGKDGMPSKTEFESYFKFAVAARPGGIRSGDMSNNVQSKQRYNESAGRYENTNVTKTSQTYYLPTISNNSGTDNNVIINNYLGNNGRLEIANQMLHVTKMLEAPEGFELTEDQLNQNFNYQIFVQGVTGERSATLTQYNQYAGVWERRLAYIDVLTDNSCLLMDNNSTRALFDLGAETGKDKDGHDAYEARPVVAVLEEGGTVYYYANEDGTPSKDKCEKPLEELYYLYLPSNMGSETTTRRLYQDSAYTDASAAYSGDNNGRTTFFTEGQREETGSDPSEGNRDSYRKTTDTDTRPAGTRTYWVLDAVLIPVSQVEPSAEPGLEAEASTTWSYETGESADYRHMNYFTLVIRKPNDETSETNFESPYKTRTMYMTTTLNFGVNANEDGDGKGTSHQPMTAADLYDQIIPSGDRPDLYGTLNADTIAKSTAEFTLKHGEGLLLTGLDNRISYRFTEKLTKKQVEEGYTVKQISHIQQRGSESIYKPGIQEVPVWTAEGAKYGDNYPQADAQTKNGLTWPGYNGATEALEPFAHTNAIMWEYYATMGANELGNHHHPEGAAEEKVDFYIGDNLADPAQKHDVLANPSCKNDEIVRDDDGNISSYIHYMYKDGELVDPHYNGEASAYLRNMARYLVSPTVHFGINGENQDMANGTPPYTETSTDYTGVFSVFGNTGWFEEQIHYVNTFDPVKLTVTKELEPEDKLTDEDKNREFDFTLTLTPDKDSDVPAPTAGYPYTIVDETGREVKKGILRTNDYKGEDYDAANDIKAETDGTWKFTLKGGQTITVERLPAEVTFKVVEDEAEGFKTNVTADTVPPVNETRTREVEDTIHAGWESQVKVTFTNIKDLPDLLNLKKTLHMEVKGGVELSGEFKFTVTPDSKNDAASDPLQRRGGFADGKLTLTMPFDTKDAVEGVLEKDLNIFDKDEFTKVGTYTYTIKEETGDIPGMTYDDRVYTAVVEVTKEEGEGSEQDKLKATLTLTLNGETVAELDFVNDYAIGKNEHVFEVTKRLVDTAGKEQKLKGGEFQFKLTAGTCNYDDPVGGTGTSPMPAGAVENAVTVTNDVKGKAYFDKIEFLRPGTYEYTIEEVGLTSAKPPFEIDTDETVYTATIVVTREDDGSLTKTVTYTKGAVPADGVAFENPIHLGGLEVKKTVTGASGQKEREFKFTVTFTDEDGTVPTDENWKEFIQVTYSGERAVTLEGNVLTFTLKDEETLTVEGLPVGMKYDVEEEDLSAEHYTTTYDPDPAEGAIPDGSNAKVSVVNDRPAPTPAIVPLRVVKNLIFSGNRDESVHGVFTFTVTPDPHNPSADPLKGEERTVKTKDLHLGERDVLEILGETDPFTAEGTYIYTVKEVPGDVPGVSYDSRVYTVTVVVKATDVDPTLWSYVLMPTVTVSDSQGSVETHTETGNPVVLQFDNMYSAYEISVPIAAHKTLKGGILQADQFQFELTAKDCTYSDAEETGTSPMPEGAVSPVTKKNLADGSVSFGDVKYTRPGQYRYTLREIPGGDTNITYDGTVYEVVVTVVRAATGELSASVTYNALSAAEFINTLKTGDLTVKKTVTGAAGAPDRDFHFTVTFDPVGDFSGVSITKYGADGSATTEKLSIDGEGLLKFTLKHNERVEIKSLPAGTDYIVTEEEFGEDGYTSTVTGDVTANGGEGEIEADGTDSVEFVNDKKAGGLTIKKTVTGTAGDPNKEFHFTVTFDPATSLSAPNIKWVHSAGGQITRSDNTLTFTLKHGQSVEITGLPVGTTYTVTETEFNKDGYTSTVTGDVTTDGGMGTIEADGKDSVEFVNDKKAGGLTIKKTVTGTAGDPNKEFHFTVTFDPETSLDAPNIKWTHSAGNDITRTGNTLTFTLKHGQSVEITGLPVGTTYTVTEKEFGEDGYTSVVKGDVTTNGGEGTIKADGTDSVEFVNDKKAGGLTIKKTVTGTAGDPEKEFHFTVTFDPETSLGAPNIKWTHSADGTITRSGNTLTFTLKHGQSVEITGLPVGTTYTVTEAEFNKDGYTSTVNGDVTTNGGEGEIEADGKDSVEFVNDKKAGGLTIKKTVTGTAGDPNKEFHFAVTFDPATSLDAPNIKWTHSADGQITRSGNTLTFTLKHGQSVEITGLPVGTTYTVTEKEFGEDGYTSTVTGDVTANGGEGTIKADGTDSVEFVNDKKAGGLTIKKTVTGTAGDPEKEFHFTVTFDPETSLDAPNIKWVHSAGGQITRTGNTLTFTLKHGQSVEITGLPVGTTYTVTETEFNEDGYTSTVTGSITVNGGEGEIEADGTDSVEFENHKDKPATGSLSVKKTVTGTAGDKSKEFHFTVTFDPVGDFGDVTITKYDADGNATTETFSIDGEGHLEFTLKHGEHVEVNGLPVGTTYTVVEKEFGEDGYTSTVTDPDGDKTDGKGEIAANDNDQAELVNHKDAPTGDLTVSKTVTGAAGDTTKEWHFHVELSDKSINGPYGDMNFTEGVADFTLKHNESATATGLPAGITYTVTEEEFNQDGYDSTSEGETGEIPEGGTANADFVNHKAPPPPPRIGNLVVTKTVTGDAGDLNKEWHFHVELSDRSINGPYGDMNFTNGVADFTLRSGESATATGLPAGVTYTVTEIEANQDGYETSSTGSTGTIPDGGTARAEFVNHKDKPNADLTVEKTVTGTAGDKDKEWHFRVEISDKSVNGQYGDMFFTNGVAEFTLKHGESATATGLPGGITYAVTEAEADHDGYDTHTNGAAGFIPEGGSAKAEFVNHKEKPDESPKTGDDRRLGFWAVMMAMSFVGIVTVSVPLLRGNRIVSRDGKHVKK